VQLVMGLGNPGPRYAATRHNVGLRCLEAAAATLGLGFAIERTGYRAAVGNGPAGPVTLLEPLTYMNRSGLALEAWAREARTSEAGTAVAPATGDDTDPGVEVPVPIVVCDDIQLPLGSIRIRPSGGDGGQNGLASVLAVVGHEHVPRLRLGVGPIGSTVAPVDWADYVLAPFSGDDRERVDDLIARGCDALLALLADGPEMAASRHNRRIRPPFDLPDAP
jgi:peptidyl-tRNA hydrolase, PTH1 family